MAWIDYKNGYDMVPQRYLKMCKISEEVLNFIKKTIKKTGDWNSQQEGKA